MWESVFGFDVLQGCRFSACPGRFCAGAYGWHRVHDDTQPRSIGVSHSLHLCLAVLSFHDGLTPLLFPFLFYYTAFL